MVRDMRKVGNRKNLKIFFFNPPVYPVFSISRSYLSLLCIIVLYYHCTHPPRLILITIMINVAIVTSHVIRRMALELGFYYSVHSNLKHHMSKV